MDHIITADDSSEMEIHSTWLDWTMTLSQLFNHEDSEQRLRLLMNSVLKSLVNLMQVNFSRDWMN
jgi:hypothetical protein